LRVNGQSTPVPGLSLVIPAWNEEQRLPRTLAQYLPALEACGHPFEVLVVVDGVENRTAEVATGLAGGHVRVIQFPTKLGKGGAIMAGVEASRYEYVGYLDADGPVPPADLLAMVDGLRNADGVVASRWIPGSRILRQQPRSRRLVGAVWAGLVRGVLFLPIHDTQCGAKVFRRSRVLPILRTVSVKNWAFDLSLIFHLCKDGQTIDEHPVTWSHDPDSRLVVTHAVPIMFLSLMGMLALSLFVAGGVPPPWVNRFALRFAA
jgi:dolichol-phosphate mannosyltransferase